MLSRPAVYGCLLVLLCLTLVSARRPGVASPLQRRSRWNSKHHSYKPPSPIEKRQTSGPSGGYNSSCFSGAANAFAQAPHANIWAGLTNDEAAQVTAFLFAQEALNLTAAENSTEWDNTLLLVELQQPNKTDVLKYIDGNGTAPTRWAHAQIDFSSVEEAYIQDFIVGPLPLVNGTATYKPLYYPYNKDKGGWQRNYLPDEDTKEKWIAKWASGIADITMELWGKAVYGLENDTATCWGIDPLWRINNRTIAWDQFWGAADGSFDDTTLLPLGLYVQSDVTGRDPSKWKILGVLYNDVYYNSTAEFRKAFYTFPMIERLGANNDGKWAQTDRDGPKLPREEIYPAVNVAPQAGRYAVDVEKKYVEWMDFSFYISFNRDTGMALHDIKYKGERIIYELSLQEALAHYAGNDPVQSGTSYLDTYYGFGPYAFELIAGYDCPTYSTFLNTTFYVQETTHTHLNSICLFERDAGYPISRHSSSKYVAATKNIVFSVRTISTVGNYDYAFTYEFLLDGTINVDVRASGYIQSAYYAKNQDYGFQIHDFLSGSMHDHVLNYKLDLDVLGTANTVATTEFVPATESYSWSGGRTRNTMKLVKGELTNEDEAAINWHPNGAMMYTVVNKDAKNKYGEYRGWRITPNSGNMIYLTVEESSNMQKAAEWTRNNFFVTKQKDTEQRSSYAYNSLDVDNPVIDFSKYLDGECIEQEDIVIWFNLGMHHVPHTGDLPNTVFTTAHSSLSITPHNYLLRNPSQQSMHSVRIDYNKGVVSKVEDFGHQEPTCAYPMSQVEANLYDYHGDVVIRKFPYDPNHWWYQTDSIV